MSDPNRPPGPHAYGATRKTPGARARLTSSITEEDLQRLRDLGLSETDVMDVVLAAAARCFFSKTLDALCVEPDARYGELEPGLREVLVVGRPIAAA